MLCKINRWLIGLSGAAIYMMCGIKNHVLAQVIPDGTLPTNVTNSENLYEITGGTQSGNNLFHSFQEFSIPEGFTAHFQNIDNIANIISRVTGGNVSFIDGILKANGFANVILLNPNGINFGPNASLNIGGAFVGSTAPELIFKDGTVFNNNPNSPVNLTVSVPLGLQWNDTQTPAEIIVNGARLAVKPEQVLLLVGGDIEVNGGSLIAQGGRVELGGLKGEGIIPVKLDENGNIVALGEYPAAVERGNVTLTNEARINVITDERGGGNIAINAANLQVEGNSQVVAGIKPNSQLGVTETGEITNVAKTGIGNIILNATGKITIQSSAIRNEIKAGSGVFLSGGNIEISAEKLEVIDGGIISTNLAGGADVGLRNIILQINGDVTIGNPNNPQDNSRISTKVNNNAIQLTGEENTGKGGTITINANSLSLNNKTSITTAITGETTNLFPGVGNAGDVIITVEKGNVAIASSQILTQVGANVEGAAGKIKITATNLTINNSMLNSVSRGSGNSGEINIQAENTIELKDGSEINSGFAPIGTAETGGNIKIIANSIFLRNDAILNTSNTEGLFGTGGKPGNIILEGKETIELDGENVLINTSAGKLSQGAAGNIEVKAKDVSVLNGARLEAATTGNQNAGKVIIAAEDTVELGQNVQVKTTIAETDFLDTGNGGDIEVTGNFVKVNGAILETETNAEGNAGNITIEAQENVSITNNSTLNSQVVKTDVESGDGGNINLTAPVIEVDNSQLTTQTEAQGNAGEIKITAADAVSINNSRFSSSTLGVGDAGNVKLEATSILALNNSNLESKAQGEGITGNAGEITLKAPQLQTNNSNISTSTSGEGLAGKIEVTTNEINLNSSNISSSTLGEGKAGNVKLEATSILALNNSNLESKAQGEGITGNAGEITLKAPQIEANNSNISTSSLGVGDAGKIEITANEINLNSSNISSSTLGEGKAGNVDINAENISLENQSKITAQSNSEQGGNITIKNQVNPLEVLQLRTGSQISATAGIAQGRGSGGNVEITTRFLILQEKSNITAEAFTGAGGNIEILSEAVIQCPSCQISASSQRGIDGEVNITTLDAQTNMDQQEVQQEVTILDNIVTTNCSAAARRRKKREGASLAIVGREGFPPSPTEPLNADTLIPFNPSSEETVSEMKTDAEENPKYPPAAQGWYVNHQGVTVFTALPIIPTGHYIPGNTTPRCDN